MKLGQEVGGGELKQRTLKGGVNSGPPSSGRPGVGVWIVSFLHTAHVSGTDATMRPGWYSL